MEQTMLKDREKFTQEQKSALEELDQRLKDRDAALTALMADILAKARTQLAAKMQEAVQKATVGRQKQQRALFAAMLLGMLLTIVGAGAGAWLSTATGCGQ